MESHLHEEPFPLYSSEISFLADSYWGSDAYHHHLQRSSLPQAPVSLPSLPIPPPPSSAHLSSSHMTSRHVDGNRWLVGDLVYIPASQWFEPAKLYRCPHAEKMFLTANVIKRTKKQVTLHVPALDQDITRGFGFMEVCCSPTPPPLTFFQRTVSSKGNDWLLLWTPQDLIRYFA
jgi:hypothetical protein